MDTISNSARKFTIRDKVYTVKPFNMFQLARIREKIIEVLKKTYKTDLLELSQGVSEKDRPKFILDAMKAKAFTPEDINEQMMSNMGLNIILSAALKETIETVENIISDQVDVEEVTDLFNFILQIEDKEVADNEKKVTT